jgi:hypothetical protein
MPGICAQVRLRLDQSAVITREGFNATLELSDQTADMDLTRVSLDLTILDANGNVVTGLFVIRPPALSGLTGVDGTGSLSANSTGSATWTIIPTSDAALHGVTQYFVGGTLKYTQDGVEVVIPLAQAPIMVHPSASLLINYFLQRDVFGDDPFTPALGPPEPFSLGLLVTNVGNGTANNVRITSAQPTITDNVRGLLIDFNLLATEVNGRGLTPSLTANFGDIGPGQTAEARWVFTSSLQGHFTDYNATFQNVDDLGDPRLSLVQSVAVHELIHVVRPIGPQATGLFAFLVNDIPDPQHLPDTLYLSDGSVAPVALGTGATVDGPAAPGHLQVHLSAALPGGWAYLQLPDPGNGLFHLVRVVRSDGTEVSLDNAWETDRTFPDDGTRPVYENLLHLLDFDSTGSYTLYYAANDTTPPQVVQVGPVLPDPRSTLVASVDVVLSKPIDPTTFDYHVLTLTRNGGPNLITSAVTVTFVSGSTYRIDGLAGLTGADGTYRLTVSAAGFLDPQGNPGIGSAFVTWTTATAAPVITALTGPSPGPRNAPVDYVLVALSPAINPASFDFHALTLTRDGGSNLITAAVTIEQMSPNTYRVNGLASLTAADGHYVLTVDAGSVRDLAGTAGVGSATLRWDLDTVAPTLVAVSNLPGAATNQPVGLVDVVFSKPIDPATFDLSALALTRNGGANLINAAVSIRQVSETVYEVSGLSALTAAEGAYSFVVDVQRLRDLAGNPGAPTAPRTWVALTTPPAPATQLLVTPHFGAPPDDNVTNTLSPTLSGTLAAANLTVDLFDVTTNTALGQAVVSGTSFRGAVTFAGPGGHRVRVRVTDAAGNFTDQFLDVFVRLTMPAVTGFENAPDPFVRAPVSSVDVTFSEPIDLATLGPAALTLTLNGGPNLLTGAVTVALVSGSTYRIGGLSGLTEADGTYVLALNAAAVRSPIDLPGVGLAAVTWLLDKVAPTSRVDALPARADSLTFLVSVTGSDPAPQPGVPSAGVSSYDVFVSIDGGPFFPWATLPASSPSAVFQGASNHTYAFRSVARDLAGNVEDKPESIEASTYVPFLTPPVTAVTTVDADTATFTVHFRGADLDGPGLALFEVFVQVDGGPVQDLGHRPAGTPGAGGTYTGSLVYQAISDGAAHTYRFYSLGIDAVGNVQPPPAGPIAGLFVTATFATPTDLEIISFLVQSGLHERSYVRTLEVTFNETAPLSDLVASLNDPGHARIRLIHYNLDGSGGEEVSLVGEVHVVDHVLVFDFGPGGIGGDPTSTAADGYYELAFDLDGSGAFATTRHFYRLLGDVTGNHVVDNLDLLAVTNALGRSGPGLEEDVDGDGTVDVFDRTLVINSLGRHLADGLQLDG